MPSSATLSPEAMTAALAPSVSGVELAAVIWVVPGWLSRSDEKHRRLEELGAAFTFDPEDPQWPGAAGRPWVRGG